MDKLQIKLPHNVDEQIIKDLRSRFPLLASNLTEIVILQKQGQKILQISTTKVAIESIKQVIASHVAQRISFCKTTIELTKQAIATQQQKEKETLIMAPEKVKVAEVVKVVEVEEVEDDDILQGFAVAARAMRSMLAKIKKEGDQANKEIELAKEEVQEASAAFKRDAEEKLGNMEGAITGRLNTQDEKLVLVNSSIETLDEFRAEMKAWRSNLLAKIRDVGEVSGVEK